MGGVVDTMYKSESACSQELGMDPPLLGRSCVLNNKAHKGHHGHTQTANGISKFPVIAKNMYVHNKNVIFSHLLYVQD